MSRGLFDEMWERINQARLQRQDVNEFRVSPETRRALVRAVESRQSMALPSMLGVETAFGVPVVVDPRMPDGVIGVMPPMTEPDWMVLSPTRSLFELGGFVPGETVDESHGMTLDELIPESIDKWKRIRQETTDDDA